MDKETWRRKVGETSIAAGLKRQKHSVAETPRKSAAMTYGAVAVATYVQGGGVEEGAVGPGDPGRDDSAGRPAEEHSRRRNGR